MLVQAKIIDVDLRVHKDKQVADVTLKFAEPNEAVVTTLWNNSVTRGDHKIFSEFAGQEVLLAIRPEIFNGNLKYSINTMVRPVPVKPVGAK